MAQMGHSSSALALEVYAKKMARSRDTGARMDALMRPAEWEKRAHKGANGTEPVSSFTSEERKAPSSSAFGTGATGLEPATSGVTGRRSNQLNYAPRRETV
jgi:hypothetical protein